MHIIPASREQVAPGFIIRRGLPISDVSMIGPFLLLDQMGPRALKAGEGQGIPPHPHRGFETITYMVSGAVEHHDSLGNKGVVRAGEVQWMTAGSGIIHAEYIAPDFKEQGGILHGYQIWVNLPKHDKLKAPGYQQFSDQQFPIIEQDGVRVKLIAGTYDTHTAPIVTHSPLNMIHVQLKAGATWTFPIPKDFEMAVYVGDGTATILGKEVVDGTIALMTDEQEITITAKTDCDCLLLGGLPWTEPVVSYGPFVMTEEHEIREAILDYQRGKFGTIPVEKIHA